MYIRTCECGSNKILDLTFVVCRDCGLRTRNHQGTTGETQSESRNALWDWNEKKYETDKQKERRIKFEDWLREYDAKKSG